MLTRIRGLSVCAVLALAACASAAQRAPSVLPYAAQPNASLPLGSYIKHVVIIVQENRSFDSIFTGYPGADTSRFGLQTVNGSVTRVKLSPIGFRDKRGDIGHSFDIAVNSWDQGKMDHFNANFISEYGTPAGTYPYSYLRHSEVKPYWAMARQYVLADHMFPTEWGPSFTGHQDLIAGTTALSATTSVADNPTNVPWGCDAPKGTTTNLVRKPATGTGPGIVKLNGGPRPCYTHVSMAVPLDERHISWRYYAPTIYKPGGSQWSAFSAIRAVRYGPDWSKDIVSPPQTVLSDAANGKLAAVSWVIPDYIDSDHPAAKSATGPSWVASVVNAIGKSSYWKSTAIVIVWDDWGGWYDNVPPPQLDYTGLGIRVPCIIVSPYARAGYVDHTQYEFGSILKFVEQAFALPSMGTSDARATSLVDAFDFTQKPRTFVPIPQAYPASFFLAQKPSYVPPDSE